MEDLSDILKRLATGSTSEDSHNGDQPQADEQAEPCEVCGGRGWLTADVPVGHPEFGRIVTCVCQEGRIEQERTARLLRYSNLGNLARFTFHSLSPEGRSEDRDSRALFAEAAQTAARYAENPSGWLVLTGPHGSGKTHLAAAIGNKCIADGHIVFFVHVPDLLDHLRATFGPTSEVSYSDLFEQVRNIPLLILDGLGSHATTPWAEEKLRQIINHRYNAALPTVVTTAGEMGEIDSYIRSRLQAPDLSRVLELRAGTPDRMPRLGRIEPAMLQRMTFESFDVRGNNPSAGQRASLEAAYRAAKNFAADPDGWLTLSGGTGVGKTHLAVAIAAQHTGSGKSVFFAFVPDLMDYLRDTFIPDSPITYDDLFEGVRNSPLLILDDLGKERRSPWAIEKLYQIIVHRHNARLPTVITSMMEFRDELDPITSRVQDPSVSQLIPIEAPDYRNKKRRPQAPRRTGPRKRPAR